MGRARNPLIKKANTQHEFTPEQILELQRCVEDPVYFIQTYCRIQHPVKGAIPFELFDYQIDMIRAFHEHKDVVVLSARQTGKALNIKEKIPTPDGFKLMENIQVDDYVLGADGKPTKVIAVSPIQYNRPCYRIHFSTGETVICDAEHLWEIQDNNTKPRGKVKVLTTQEMVDDGYLISNSRGYTEGRYSVKVTKPLDLPNKELKIDPYVLGAWLGDGTTKEPCITNHIQDYEIIENITEHYEIEHILDHQVSRGTKRYRFKELQRDLKEIGVFGNKHIPIEYLRSSYDQRLSLLQGLMDTNGYVNQKTGLCEITFTNKRLIEDTKQLISSLGLKCTIKERNINGALPHTRWTITFTPYKTQCDVFRLERKATGLKEKPDPLRKESTQKRTITKIEQVESVPVKCIVVDNDDHLFLVGESLIPTHNSTVSSMYLLWFAIFNFDKTILIASNKNKGAMEMISRIQYAYQHIPHWLKPGVTEDGWNKHSIKFDNDSRIESEATSENSGRGMSISLLYLDEFAFVAPSIADEFWTAIAPTLSTGGSCIMSSTPNGDSNLFAQIWRGAQVDANGFFPVEVRWDQPPGRDEKFKEEQIGKIGELRWRQEYECEFLSSDALLIDSVVLSNLTKIIKEIKPAFKIKDVVFWKKPESGKTYLVGVDPATGSGEDFTVIEVVEFPAMVQVAEFRSNSMSSAFVYPILKNILKLLESAGSNVFFSVENNGVGEGIIALYESDEHPPEYAEFVSEQGKNRLGMTTTHKSKMRACLNLKEMIEKNTLKIVSPTLLKELKEYTRKSGSYAARTGSTDDCISAMLIIMRLLLEISSFEQDAFDKLHQIEEEEWSSSDYSDAGDDSPLPMIF